MYFSALSNVAAWAAVVHIGAAAVLPVGPGSPGGPLTVAPSIAASVINNAATNVVQDSYIIVYKQNLNSSFMATHDKKINGLAKGPGGTGFDFNGFRGYHVLANKTSLQSILALPGVDYVEKDGIMSTATQIVPRAVVTQVGSPWGLGRISHVLYKLPNYVYDTDAKYAQATSAYIVDTGIYTAHSQFGGRAVWGANFISGSPNTDEHGHGTHCAGTIGGTTYGIARTTRLVAVKVLDKTGSGTFSGVLSGIQWAVNDAMAKGLVSKSVVSMSLAGGYSAAVNDGITAAVNKGMTIVVAAGNNNQDASLWSPASAPAAITVGAIDQTDKRASFSNYGTALDLFAPGVDVISAWIGATNAYASASGTSMATPHVAGLAAYLLSRETLTTPAALVNRILSLATTGKVVDAMGSPNRIAYNGAA